MVQPWDPLPGEEDAFPIFVEYLQGGTLHEVAKAQDLSAGYVGSLAARYRWRARREAWRAHLHQEMIRAAESEARAMGLDLTRAWAAGVHLATLSLEDAVTEGSRVSARDALAIVEAAQKQAHLAAGRPTERMDLRGSTPEALEAALALLEGRATLPPTERELEPAECQAEPRKPDPYPG